MGSALAPIPTPLASLRELPLDAYLDAHIFSFCAWFLWLRGGARPIGTLLSNTTPVIFCVSMDSSLYQYDKKLFRCALVPFGRSEWSALDRPIYLALRASLVLGSLPHTNYRFAVSIV
jgi:hypothetical protein